MDEMLTTEEAAKFLGYSAKTLRNWRQEGKKDAPKYYKPMGKILYSKKELVEWIKNK